MKNFYPFLLKFELGKELILLNTVLERGFKKQSSFSKNPTKLKVVYFKGCVNEYINPKIKNASEYLLNRMGVEILPINFTCCGISYLNDGNVDLFLNFAYKNLSNIPDDFDYFLTDCVTCKYTFELYEKYITDEKLRQKIHEINKKSLSVSEFVVKNTKKISFKKNISFTFHKPCHMQNDELIKDFIKKCTQAKYEQMPDSCCGFSGTFAIKHREISKKISKQNALMNANNILITTCPACLMGLNQGLIANNHAENFSKHLIEFIAENIV